VDARRYANLRGLLGMSLIVLAGNFVPVAQTGQGPADASLPATRHALNAGTEPVRIVCFGDSVTGVYYHTGGRRAYADMLEIALERIYPGASLTVINAGISGHATPDALARIDDDVLKHRPQLVTVMFGLNDMTHVPLEAYAKNLGAVIQQCRAIGAEVLLCTPNAVVDTEGRPTAVLEEYVAAIRRVGSDQNVPVVDCYAAFQAVRSQDEFEFGLLMSDEIHPNMDGHKLIAETIAAAISGQTVSLDDVGFPESAIPKTRLLLSENKPVKVYAMPPFDALIGPALRSCVPSAQFEVTTWPVEGRNLSEIEEDAKQVRNMGVDLVVVAIPVDAAATTPEQFIRSYSWVMNYALSFGHQEWDVIALPPSVANPDLTIDDIATDQLARRLIRAQDLGTITRAPADGAPADELLTAWLKSQLGDSPQP
jgi:lysophospholipase L1-like esterase